MSSAPASAIVGRWAVDRLTRPFGRVGGVFDVGWNVQPKAPAIAARRVFLTDGRAISYAESVMGFVADRKLGTILGAPTAGTNGNVCCSTCRAAARSRSPECASRGTTGPPAVT